jgi:hypothetical protein
MSSNSDPFSLQLTWLAVGLEGKSIPLVMTMTGWLMEECR